MDADAEPGHLTVPTDPNGRTSGSGARFVAMELTSTTEVLSFRAPNGTRMHLFGRHHDDGVHDRLCWVTWWSTSATSFNRQGMAVYEHGGPSDQRMEPHHGAGQR